MIALSFPPASGGNSESACRNNNTSPEATLAPAFCCNPLPGAESNKRTSSCSASHSRLPSVLPPSTTMMSAPGIETRTESIHAGRHSRSFNTGIMADIVMKSSQHRALEEIPAQRRDWSQHYLQIPVLSTHEQDPAVYPDQTMGVLRN